MTKFIQLLSTFQCKSEAAHVVSYKIIFSVLYFQCCYPETSDHFAIFLGASREAEQAQTKNSTHHNLLTQRWCKLWTVSLPWLLQIPFWHLDIERLQQPAHLNALLSKYKLWFSSFLHIAWKSLAYKLLDKILFVAVIKTFVCCKLT